MEANDNVLVPCTELQIYDPSVILPFRVFELIEEHILHYFDEDTETSNNRMREIKEHKEILLTALSDSTLTTKYLYNKICVYIHRNLDNKEVFYVGIGNSRRPYVKRGRNSSWCDYTTCNNYEVVVIHKNLSWEEAANIEKTMIREIGRKDLSLGTLVNLSNGGEGYRFGTIWSIDKLKQEVLKYNNKTAFRKNSQQAYMVARRIGIIDDICSHMIKAEYWSENKIFEEAFKYSYKTDFRKGSPAAFNKAVSLGIITDVCDHMMLTKGMKNIPLHLLPMALEMARNYKRNLPYTKTKIEIEKEPRIKKIIDPMQGWFDYCDNQVFKAKQELKILLMEEELRKVGINHRILH